MSTVVTCPRCHHGNELGRIFCTQCGSKLDMASLAHGGGRSFNLPGLLQGAGRVIVCLGLLALLALLLWPVTPAGQCGQAEEASVLPGQREALQQALQHGQALQQEVSETALNAYLATALQLAHSNEAAGAGWLMNLAELNVAVRPGVVIVTALAHWGPLTLTWEVRGAPQVANRRFALAVQAGRIGHLGLPRRGADWLAARVGALFNRWSVEHQVLDQLAGVTAAQDNLILVAQATAAQP